MSTSVSPSELIQIRSPAGRAEAKRLKQREDALRDAHDGLDKGAPGREDPSSMLYGVSSEFRNSHCLDKH